MGKPHIVTIGKIRRMFDNDDLSSLYSIEPPIKASYGSYKTGIIEGLYLSIRNYFEERKKRK